MNPISKVLKYSHFSFNLDWAHLINKVENVLQGKRVQRGKLVFYLRVIAAF